jgi:hypothetical protein
MNILEHHIPFEVDGLGKSLHVHHKDGVKGNNRPENLEVMCASEHNSMHMRGDANPSRRFPERNPVKLNPEIVRGENNGRYRAEIDTAELQEMRSSGLTNAAIARKIGCSEYTVAKRLGWVRPEKQQAVNHRVVSVEFLPDAEDVYCGTVEETGRFFVACGENVRSKVSRPTGLAFWARSTSQSTSPKIATSTFPCCN